ncbi:hypothetical protein ACIRRA_45080, partial [Nocardia sp. NPDC101769]|uniref:hypothetical protein n=1 Tax=Nocardia sp. NPDC101769 TaxID=3364333 RepID=UPI00381E1ED2
TTKADSNQLHPTDLGIQATNPDISDLRDSNTEWSHSSGTAQRDCGGFTGLLVCEHGAEDDVGESALRDPQRLQATVTCSFAARQ